MKFIHLTPAAIVFVQFGALAVGMASWLDDDEDGGDSGGDGEFGMDDGDDFDDEFGSFDEMDGGGGGGAQDASVNELEHRLEDLETEVSNVASKANTVRSENEQISESVEDVEENVRKLLEIYEMVTRGVNPFVDDVNADAMGGGGSESFGLFDDQGGDGDEEAESELDADIAEADADDFFEDDAFDDDLADEVDDFDDEFGDLEEDAEIADSEDELADEETDADSDSGTSFEELKAEYESGEADWAGEDDGEVAGDGDFDDPIDEDDDSLGFDDSDLEGDEDATSEADDGNYGGFEFGPETVDERDQAGGDVPGAPSIGLADRGDGPHLAEPPTGYLADVVALEWLDHMLSEFGARNTVRTLNYYKRIGWIGEPVRDQLFDYLEGLTDSDYLYRDEFGTTELTMDDHMTSLDYIDELASENIERAIVERFDDLQTDGIQR